MNSLQKLNLNYNPFRDITPSMESNTLLWAEMEEVKTKIEKSYTESIKNNSKQLVLNWGPYGGGKTFSAYYFIKNNNNLSDLTQIYLRCPKDGSKSTDEFFKSIIDYISFDKIHLQIKSLISEYGEQKLMEMLIPKTSHEYAKAICLIGSSNDDIVELMNRFLYVGLTKTELKKLGLAKDIQSDTDVIKFLSGILHCFIGDNNIPIGKVIIWIDEMEDLIYYSPKHYKGFSQVLRDLFDSISSSFLVFLNFTLAEGEESTIELILGGAVWSRVTRKIRYKQFSNTNALEYCSQLIQHAKIDKNKKQPIDEETTHLLINHMMISNLTPREINKHFNSLINYAIENNINEINQDVLANWMKEYEEDNL